MIPRLHRTNAPASAAFSLVELLVVVGVIAILATAAIPAFSAMVRSGRLATGGRALIDEINVARQTAMSRNVPVEVRLYKLPPEGQPAGTATAWRGVQSFELSNGAERPLAACKTFPTGVQLSTDTDQSSLLTLTEQTPTQDVGAYSKNAVRYVAFRFNPGGFATLTNGNNGATLVLDKDRPLSEGANFIAVSINPVTGAVKAYRP